MALEIDDEYPEVLAIIARTAFARLCERGHPEDVASADAFAVAESVRLELGGTAPYISKGMAWELTQRDREIYAKSRGSNYAALALEYGISEMRVRQIVQRCRAEHFRSLQPQLL